MVHQQHEPTPADLFAQVGRAIFDSDDWEARLASTLGVRRDTVRQWCSGHLNLRPDHFESLLALATRRRAELDLVERQLRARLDLHQDPDPGEG